MSAPLDAAAPEVQDHYLVSHGKSGALGSYRARLDRALNRGDRVVIDGPRGREIGTVLCDASVRQARLLGAVSTGVIIRAVSVTDAVSIDQIRATEQQLFEAGRVLARDLPIEILDVEVLFDARAIVQFIGPEDTALEQFALALGQAVHLEIRLENLALAGENAPADDHHCDKPDCGKAAGGGCSTCSTGGGCSSCGTGPADLRPYFGHLRAKMDATKRTSLV